MWVDGVHAATKWLAWRTARAAALSSLLVVVLSTSVRAQQATPTIPRAHDGRSLAQETFATRATFTTVWGTRASAQWIEEHNAELARARSSPPVRVAYIAGAAPGADADEFLQRFRELGWTPGRDVVFEWRSAEGSEEALQSVVSEIVNLSPDVIAASTGGNLNTVNGVAKGSPRIPILILNVGDVNAGGLIASPERPEGNLTGFSLNPPDVWAKRLELIKVAVPGASRVAFLWNPDNTANAALLREAQTAAPRLGIQLQPLEVRDAAGTLEAAFAAADRERADAILPTPAIPGLPNGQARLIELARLHKQPVLGASAAFVEAGGLMAHVADPAELPRRRAEYLDKLLKGTKVADLPMAYPTQFEVRLNQKAADSIGFTFPPALLAQASVVIR